METVLLGVLGLSFLANLVMEVWMYKMGSDERSSMLKSKTYNSMCKIFVSGMLLSYMITGTFNLSDHLFKLFVLSVLSISLLTGLGKFFKVVKTH